MFAVPLRDDDEMKLALTKALAVEPDHSLEKYAGVDLHVVATKKKGGKYCSCVASRWWLDGECATVQEAVDRLAK